MKFFGILTVALVCAFGLAANAQEQSKEKIKVKGEGARTVSYTGCVATGTETTTYLLNSAVPVTKSVEQRETEGTTTTTTYVLVPGSETVTFTNLVGHKVEVTGVLIPAGKETKVKSKTEIERQGAPDVKIEQRTKTNEASMPHFRVVSVKQLSDPCTP